MKKKNTLLLLGGVIGAASAVGAYIGVKKITEQIAKDETLFREQDLDTTFTSKPTASNNAPSDDIYQPSVYQPKTYHTEILDFTLGEDDSNTTEDLEEDDFSVANEEPEALEEDFEEELEEEFIPSDTLSLADVLSGKLKMATQADNIPPASDDDFEEEIEVPTLEVEETIKEEIEVPTLEVEETIKEEIEV
ncbi:MAG: hypothetical protein R3Y12_06815, partial [Clostridia bacterium]